MPPALWQVALLYFAGVVIVVVLLALLNTTLCNFVVSEILMIKQATDPPFTVLANFVVTLNTLLSQDKVHPVNMSRPL